MKISVLSSVSEQIPEGNFVWIALDVIRATSTIVTFLAQGGKSVLVTDSIDLATREKLKDPSVILIGERGGIKIDGFDFDNSPVSLVKHADQLTDARAIMTTTNGTNLLIKLQNTTTRILVGSLLNLSSVVREAFDIVQKEQFDGIGVACAGKEGRLVGDDFYCAGLIVSRLLTLSNANMELDDAAKVSLSWAKVTDDPLDVLMQSESGGNILRYGKDADIKFCSQIDLYAIVPKVVGNIVTR
ncbi:MAG: 2-phosphosulfolactate phosphatase [Coprothermobacter sp.]|nr:2-phosphosulfolactate phosphatase [Coprothermobacter sp.]